MGKSLRPTVIVKPSQKKVKEKKIWRFLQRRANEVRNEISDYYVSKGYTGRTLETHRNNPFMWQKTAIQKTYLNRKYGERDISAWKPEDRHKLFFEGPDVKFI